MITDYQLMNVQMLYLLSVIFFLSACGTEQEPDLSLSNLSLNDQGLSVELDFRQNVTREDMMPAEDMMICESSTELYNGLDDDCDGDIDEYVINVPSATLQLGLCEQSYQVCQEGVFVDPNFNMLDGYEPIEQSCDGLDNDCDGIVDEGFPRQTTCGVGACARVGFGECREGVLADSCDSGIPEPSDQCDGVDNDCDGQIDEASAPLAAKQDGVCAGALQVCVPDLALWGEPN